MIPESVADGQGPSHPPMTRPARGHLLRWVITIALTLLWLWVMVGVAWYSGDLRPWVYEVLS